MDAPNPHLVARMQDHRFSIFGEMSALAVRSGAINLGQGFPDTDGPLEVLESAVTAIREGHNQYPPDRGIASLRQAVADHQQRFYGQSVDPENVVISTGAPSRSLPPFWLCWNKVMRWWFLSPTLTFTPPVLLWRVRCVVRLPCVLLIILSTQQS